MERAEIAAMLLTEGRSLGVVMSPEEWEPTITAYLTEFGHMPAHCVSDAFAAWKRGEGEKNPLWATIFPRIDQLAPLAEPFWLQERARLYRERRQQEGPRQFTAEERAEERRKMIEAGYLNADGSVNLAPKLSAIPEPERPHMSRQAMAEQLRRSDAQARQGGAPISRSHFEDDAGEVL